MDNTHQLLGLNKNQMANLIKEISKKTRTSHVQRGVAGRTGTVVVQGDKVTLTLKDTQATQRVEAKASGPSSGP